ncbi:MAG: hypothetical protein AAF968_01920, partial [Pseudomonadota bacterium]
MAVKEKDFARAELMTSTPDRHWSAMLIGRSRDRHGRSVDAEDRISAADFVRGSSRNPLQDRRVSRQIPAPRSKLCRPNWRSDEGQLASVARTWHDPVKATRHAFRPVPHDPRFGVGDRGDTDRADCGGTDREREKAAPSAFPPRCTARQVGLSKAISAAASRTFSKECR